MMHVAIDQYGTRLYLHGKHPRKLLLEQLNRKHASKVYLDKKDGGTVHVGYIVAGSWWSLYRLVENPA